ncbi:type II secretion system protein GspL [Burkholderia plantarii]|uniref:General secretion pathway protein L n=1 Tax=Burkholderia plantarii TaxID=41899 RepID=A0A0B6S305_BURPL|nr:type II secretion system protein GspL [Burkholderia plantarii]AJK50048.1 general secretion pathway protein L [Burkholderia plantarii]
MSSLIVLLPPLDALDAASWRDAPLPYARFDRHGRLERAGVAAAGAWPAAGATVLVLAARDTLLLDVTLPPVTGAKLRRLLPNVVEEHLIDDPQRCHVAVGPALAGQTQRQVAVVDRERFGALLDAFAAGGRRRLRAVPLIHCMPPGAAAEPVLAPPGDATPAAADANSVPPAVAVDDATNRPPETPPPVAEVLIVSRVPRGGAADDGEQDEAGPGWLDVAVKQGRSGFGFATHASALDGSIASLASRQRVTVHALAVTPVAEPVDALAVTPADEPADEPAGAAVMATVATTTATAMAAAAVVTVGDPAPETVASAPASAAAPLASAFPLAARTMPWETLARGALGCPFDLCQFEFAPGARGGGASAAGLRPWRFAIGVAAAALALALVTVNLDWYRLRAREAALTAQMSDLLRAALPGTHTVLDPPAQLHAGVERLRAEAGEPRADDFAVLAAALARALGPVPSDAIATLDYRDGGLELTFKPGTPLDADGLRRRLQAQGLSIQEDNAKWTLGSARHAKP